MTLVTLIGKYLLTLSSWPPPSWRARGGGVVNLRYTDGWSVTCTALHQRSFCRCPCPGAPTDLPVGSNSCLQPGISTSVTTLSRSVVCSPFLCRCAIPSRPVWPLDHQEDRTCYSRHLSSFSPSHLPSYTVPTRLRPPLHSAAVQRLTKRARPTRCVSNASNLMSPPTTSSVSASRTTTTHPSASSRRQAHVAQSRCPESTAWPTTTGWPTRNASLK